MGEKAITKFQVSVTSVEEATWQGIVEADGKSFQFKSELQLLRWMMEQFPALRPDVKWE